MGCKWNRNFKYSSLNVNTPFAFSKEVQAHRKILGGNQTIFFGNGIVPIEMFEKNMFQICHMMGVTTHKATMGREVGVAFVVLNYRSFALLT